LRIGFELPPGISRANLEGKGKRCSASCNSGQGAIYNEVRAANVTWRDIEWMRSFLPVPLLLKGILRVEDAITAHKCGCDGVIVSNHGGRALDGTPGALTVLPEIIDRVGT